MTTHFLAHLNVVRPVSAISPESPELVYFFSRLMEIFAAAKTSPGMKWHNHGARRSDGSYLDLSEFMLLETSGLEENPHVLTMAGWDSTKAMHNFAYRLRPHVEGMKRLRHWVDRSEGATMVMWWVPAGSRVSLEDGWQRLEMLRNHGPSPDAFTLQSRFDPPSVKVA